MVSWELHVSINPGIVNGVDTSDNAMHMYYGTQSLLHTHTRHTIEVFISSLNIFFQTFYDKFLRQFGFKSSYFAMV